MQIKLPGRREGENTQGTSRVASLRFSRKLAALAERSRSKVLPGSLYNSDSAEAPVPAHLSRCQNLTLYQSFCAMKYAIYALCVNQHQHMQCQECKDRPSEDLASAAEPASDSLSSPGTEPAPHPFPSQSWGQRVPGASLCRIPLLPGLGRWPWFYYAQE